MARNFASVDYIDFSIGALSGNDGGPCTVAAILKLNGTTGGVLELRESGGTSVCALSSDSGTYYFSTRGGGSFSSILTSATADNWHLVAATKAAGTVNPRGHKYVYDTNTWTHANGGGTVQDHTGTAGASGSVRVGRCFSSAADHLEGEIAAVGVWNRALTDAEIEQLAFSLVGWLSTAPDALWVLDQSATGQNVPDITGGGANQAALTGTAVSTVSHAVFSYSDAVVASTRQPAAGGTSQPLSTALETDTALTLGETKTKAATTATEADTAISVGRVKAKAIGTAVETSSALTFGKGKTKSFSVALESDTAQVLGRAKTRSIGLAQETDLAQAFGRAKTKALGLPTESDTAQPLGEKKARLLGLATETDTALTLSRRKAKAPGIALESDQALVIGTGDTTPINTALETNTALQVGKAKVKPIGTAVETSTALTVGRVKVKALATTLESDTALALSRGKSRILSTAAETSTAFGVGRRKGKALIAALEVDVALPLSTDDDLPGQRYAVAALSAPWSSGPLSSSWTAGSLED